MLDLHLVRMKINIFLQKSMECRILEVDLIAADRNCRTFSNRSMNNCDVIFRSLSYFPS